MESDSPKRYFYTLCFPFIFSLILLIAQSAHAFDVNAIRLGQNNGQLRIVLDTDRPSEYRGFVLDNPARLVIDLPQFSWSDGRFSSVQSAQIESLRLGNLHPDTTRLVFDLKDNFIIDHAFTLPRASGKDPRLVLDLRPASPAEMAQAANKIYGTLNPQNASSAPLSTPASSQGISDKIILPAPGQKPKRQAAAQAPVKIQPPSPQPAPKPAPVQRKQKPLIVLDAGHGGKDPGAIGPQKQREKDIVLNLARDVRDMLLATGKYRVKLTRDSDTYIRLRGRIKIARDADADLFISLHADSLPRKNVRGASFYTLSENASDKETAALAARENRSDIIAGVDLTDEDQEVASILMDLVMRDTMNQSKYLANSLVETFRGENVKVLENPHRYAGFAVLKAPDIPSVLIESGFISNGTDAALLSRRDHRTKIARAIQKAIDRYFATLEQNSQ